MKKRHGKTDLVFLTFDEVRAVLKAAQEESDERWLAFLVAFWHGLRASEVCKLDGARIQDQHIDVRRLKGSRHTRQPFINHPDPLFNELVPLRKLSQETGLRSPVFPSLYREGDLGRFVFHRWFVSAAKAAKLPKWKQHPHCLKHSTAWYMLHPPAGCTAMSIEELRQWLGHESLNSTGAYLKINDQMAAQAAMAAIIGTAVAQ